MNKLWVPVSGLQTVHALPGDANVSFETFHISFNPVSAKRIRLRGPNPETTWLTCGELRVFATDQSLPTTPTSRTATLTVGDPEGLERATSVVISLNNTPPSVTITSPTEGQTYPVGITSAIPLTADVSDVEHGPSELACRWEVELVHDNHSHPEPFDPNCVSSLMTVPHGELMGNILFWRVKLTVTDDAGLSTAASRDVIPEGDCNLNGIDDALDISTGTSFDVNTNGRPDECEGISRLRRVQK